MKVRATLRAISGHYTGTRARRHNLYELSVGEKYDNGITSS